MLRDGVFRTSDMALAATLVVHGYSNYTMERRSPESRSVVWVFDADDDATAERGLPELWDEYEDRAAQVEPRAFVAAFTRLRDDLYDFLGKGSRRERAAGRDGA